MDKAHDRFVHFQNIDAFKAQLLDPTLPPEQRAMITLLLAEETRRGRAAGWRRPLL